MTAKVYDFKTGQLCKCCMICKYWKGCTDFPAKNGGTYGRGPVCQDCIDSGKSMDGDDFNFTLDNGDDNEVA